MILDYFKIIYRLNRRPYESFRDFSLKRKGIFNVRERVFIIRENKGKFSKQSLKEQKRRARKKNKSRGFDSKRKRQFMSLISSNE